MLEEPLTSMTEDDGGTWWPSPTDPDFAMELHALPGRYDSIFVSLADAVRDLRYIDCPRSISPSEYLEKFASQTRNLQISYGAMTVSIRINRTPER
jgi:hypothetical protein